MNTLGAKVIPGNATCTITPPIVGLMSAGSGDNYTFSSSGSTARMQAAINAWHTLGGATVNQDRA
jgi:hypothetical protein